MEPSTSGSTIRARIVLLGESSVGKTSILNRLLESRFDPSESPTVGANWQLWRHEMRGKHLELQIWDTAGQEKFRALGPLYYRDSVAAILVYDITNLPSFENLPSWISAYSGAASGGSIIIAGNKADSNPKRTVSHEVALRWAQKQGYPLYETSAKTGENISELFAAVSEAIIYAKGSGQKVVQGMDLGENKSSCC
jgi:small GTP-binding protein